MENAENTVKIEIVELEAALTFFERGAQKKKREKKREGEGLRLSIQKGQKKVARGFWWPLKER